MKYNNLNKLFNGTMKFAMLTIGLGLFAATGCFAQMTLQEAVNTATGKNNGIKSYQKAVETKTDEIAVAKGRYMPTVSLEAAYTHLNDDLTIDLNPIRSAMIQLEALDQVNFANIQAVMKYGQELSADQQALVKTAAMQQLNSQIPAFKAVMKEQNFPSASITLTQPIFTGGKIEAGVKAAEAQKDLANAKLNSESQTVTTDVVTYYLNVLLAKENLSVREHVLEGVKKHENLAEKSLLEGLIANNDKLRADVALSEAERNVYEAQQKLEIAKSALASVIEYKDGTLPELSETLKYADPQIQLNDAIAAAKNENVNLLQLRSGAKALNAKAEASKGDYYPTIYGFGKYNAFKHYLSILDPDWAIGIGLKYDLFTGKKRINEYEANKSDAESMEYLTLDAERKIELLCRTQYMQMNLAKDSYKKLETTAAQAEENLRLNSRRFEEGLGTSLEALDAELNLEGVLLKKAAALSDYYNAMYSLYQTAGKSDEFVKYWTNNN